MIVFRILLFPFTLLYGSLLFLRNVLFDTGILSSVKFDLPVLNVGNLAFGGTGKTPHIEYLIRLLKDEKKVAVLSRGYRRKTRGYVYAEPETPYTEIGDEPCQIKQKFGNEIALAVCENRLIGVPNLLYDAPETEVLLLDDAFQHRPVKPGLNILLTNYQRPYTRDFLAPAGLLREYRSASQRAHVIVVTKCPADMSDTERSELRGELKPLPYQSLFFSFQIFGTPCSVYGQEKYSGPADVACILLSGIANNDYFAKAVTGNFSNIVTHFKFSDHHHYSEKEIQNLCRFYDETESPRKIIMTTEKDAVRLHHPKIYPMLKDKNIFYLPLEVDFFPQDKINFNDLVYDYIERDKRSY